MLYGFDGYPHILQICERNNAFMLCITLSKVICVEIAGRKYVMVPIKMVLVC